MLRSITLYSLAQQSIGSAVRCVRATCCMYILKFQNTCATASSTLQLNHFALRLAKIASHYRFMQHE